MTEPAAAIRDSRSIVLFTPRPPLEHTDRARLGPRPYEVLALGSAKVGVVYRARTASKRN